MADVRDLFQMANVLSVEDRFEIIGKLRELNRMYPYCSACSSSVDIAFMRKLPGEDLNQAMCLPCYLNNHTDTEQSLIDRIVKIGEIKGWYYDD